MEGGWLGSGNIDADPLFADPTNNDYRLQASSPCIDAGTASGAPDKDLESIVRPLDGSNNGTAEYDIGCYEFVHPNADTDKDNQKDADEIIAGTSPTNSSSYFGFQSAVNENDSVVVTWNTVQGRLYDLKSSTNLASSPAWTNVLSCTNMLGTGSTMSYTNNSPKESEFYKVKARTQD